MYKRLLAILVFVSMFSIYPIAKLAYSNPADDTKIVGTDPSIVWSNRLTLFRNKEKFLLSRQSTLGNFTSVIRDLNGTWDAYNLAVENGNDANTSESFAILIGAIAAIPFTGGTSTTAVLITYAPTLYSAFNEYQNTLKTATKVLTRDKHLEGFKKIMLAYESMYAYHKSEYEKYTDFYINQYMATMLEHGDLYTSVSGSALSTNDFYLSINGRRLTLSTSDGSRSIGPIIQPTQTSGYYHLESDYYGNNRLGSTNHVMELHLHWDDIDVAPIEAKYKCEGSKQPGNTCAVMFITPYGAHKDHFRKCGTAKSLKQLVRETMYSPAPMNLDSFSLLLKLYRSVEDGCGYEWWSCDSHHATRETRHRVLTCKLNVIGNDGSVGACLDDQGNPLQYRICMYWKRDHDLRSWRGGTKLHSNSSDEGADAGDSDDDSDDDDDSTADSTPSTPSYHVCASHQSWQSGEHSAASCGQSGHFVCDSLSHVEEQCTTTNTNGGRCTYTFWRCVHPNVPSYGPSHIHTYPVPPPPAVFTASLSLTYTSSTSSVSMTANANEPIFGADLYVRFPGDTSTYGTKIGWTSGNSNATTYSLPVNYSFPASATSGTYKFTLRVYPFNNSGSGNAWGNPVDVFEDVTVD